MNLGRTTLAIVLAGSLAACGGDGGTGGFGGGTGFVPTPAPAPAPAPAPTPAQCSLADRQSWVLGQLNDFYLFPDLLDTSVNPANFRNAGVSDDENLQAYINALVAPARAQSIDRFFTFITSIQEENDLINSGSSAGFGIRLGFDSTNQRLFVLEAFENGPAFPAGIDRGTEITSIDGTSVASLFQNGGSSAVNSALGPSTPGLQRTLGLRQPSGSTSTVTVTKAEFAIDPISDRYGVRVFNNGGTPVGYINLRTFIVSGAGDQLRTAINTFRQQNITEVILDFRYNGGGLVSVANLLGDLLGQDKVGQQFSRTEFRASLSSNDSVELFETQAEGIAATKIALIGSPSTASASELIGNSFIPYLGNNTALIGRNTFGKPSGQIARDRDVCDDRLRVTAFRTVNRDGGGDYYTGLASVYSQTCAAQDDFLTPLGDAAEDSVSEALGFLRGTACTAITASGSQRAFGGTRLQTLQPSAPTAAQFQIPGLY